MAFCRDHLDASSHLRVAGATDHTRGDILLFQWGADTVVVLECVRIGSETLDECVLEFPAKGEKETSTPIRPDTADVMIGEPMADGSVHCSRNESMWEHWMRLGSSPSSAWSNWNFHIRMKMGSNNALVRSSARARVRRWTIFCVDEATTYIGWRCRELITR